MNLPPTRVDNHIPAITTTPGLLTPPSIVHTKAITHKNPDVIVVVYPVFVLYYAHASQHATWYYCVENSWQEFPSTQPPLS